MAKTFSTIVSNVTGMVGDTSATFRARVENWVNMRHRDVMMRCNATMWTHASYGDMGGASIPLLNSGDILEYGAIADAWDAKRQFAKGTKYEQKFEFALAKKVMSGDQNQFLASTSRYGYHV